MRQACYRLAVRLVSNAVSAEGLHSYSDTAKCKYAVSLSLARGVSFPAIDQLQEIAGDPRLGVIRKAASKHKWRCLIPWQS